MTEQDNTQQEETNPISGHTELYGDDFSVERMEQLVEWLGAEEGRLNDGLWYYRRSYRNAREQMDAYYKRAEQNREAHQSALREVDATRYDLREALVRLHGNDEPFNTDWQGWETVLRIGLTTGIMAGYAGEAHQLADRLASEFNQVVQVWSEVSSDLRGPDGRYVEPVPIEMAAEQALRRFRHRLSVSLLDPRLDEGTLRIWKLAKGSDMCEVFDNIATAIGLHKQELTQSGTVTVRFNGSVDIDVSEVEGDIWAHIDSHDVAEAVSGYDIEIDSIDTDYLSWD